MRIAVVSALPPFGQPAGQTMIMHLRTVLCLLLKVDQQRTWYLNELHKQSTKGLGKTNRWESDSP
jgi:hypothetical protein